MALAKLPNVLVSSPAVAAQIAQRTRTENRTITVSRMVGTKDVAQFMRLVSAAGKSTRKMGLLVR